MKKQEAKLAIKNMWLDETDKENFCRQIDASSIKAIGSILKTVHIFVEMQATETARLLARRDEWRNCHTTGKIPQSLRPLLLRIAAQDLYNLRGVTGFCSGSELSDMFASVCGDPSPAGRKSISVLSLTSSETGLDALEFLAGSPLEILHKADYCLA